MFKERQKIVFNHLKDKLENSKMLISNLKKHPDKINNLKQELKKITKDATLCFEMNFLNHNQLTLISEECTSFLKELDQE